MGVVEKLNALDERAGAGRPSSPRQWALSIRLWWLGLVVAYVMAIAGILATLFGDVAVAPVTVVFLPAVFWSGFFYNERLRARREKPRLMRVPDGWPDETT